jgi:hypothetical protein
MAAGDCQYGLSKTRQLCQVEDFYDLHQVISACCSSRQNCCGRATAVEPKHGIALGESIEIADTTSEIARKKGNSRENSTTHPGS